MGWTKVPPHKTLGGVCSGNIDKEPTNVDQEECEDPDHLHTPTRSDDDDEGVRFLTYKSGDGMRFHLGIMFTNKEVIRDVIEDSGMEHQKMCSLRRMIQKGGDLMYG